MNPALNTAPPAGQPQPYERPEIVRQPAVHDAAVAVQVFKGR